MKRKPHCCCYGMHTFRCRLLCWWAWIFAAKFSSQQQPWGRPQPDNPLTQPAVASPQAHSLHALERPPSSITVAMREVNRLNSSRDRTRGVETAPGKGSRGVETMPIDQWGRSLGKGIQSSNAGDHQLKLLAIDPRVAQDPLHRQEVGVVGDEQCRRTERVASSARCAPISCRHRGDAWRRGQGGASASTSDNHGCDGYWQHPPHSCATESYRSRALTQHRRAASTWEPALAEAMIPGRCAAMSRARPAPLRHHVGARSPSAAAPATRSARAAASPPRGACPSEAAPRGRCTAALRRRPARAGAAVLPTQDGGGGGVEEERKDGDREFETLGLRGWRLGGSAGWF